ncbi:5-hydroxytryptamine receptor 1f, partial [Plakobranchus ocellatus]
VADILVSALVTPIVTATRWKRMWLLGAAACDLQAIINHTCLFASLFNLAAIAVSRIRKVWFFYEGSPQQGDPRLSGHDAVGGARTRTRDRRLLTDLRADTLAAEPPTSRNKRGGEREGE